MMKRLSLLLLTFLLGISAVAQKIDSRGWKFHVSQTGAHIIGHTTPDSLYNTSLDIPATVSSDGQTYPVVSVVGFQGYKNATSITFANSITHILVNAFSGCTGLRGPLVLPSNLQVIMSGAFNGCSGLTGSLVIPNSVTTLGGSAFANCTGFAGTLTLSNQLTKIENDVFRDCTGFTGGLEIPEGVTAIGDLAFRTMESLTGELSLPSTLKTIGPSAFQLCKKLTGNLRLPEGLTTVGGGAFANCEKLDGVLTLPASITRIGAGAFRGCTQLKGQLGLPPGLISIEYGIFWGCENLTGEIRIPLGVQSIGEHAFRGCKNITGELTIPSTVTSIGGVAFLNCSGLTGNLSLPANLRTIGLSAFNGCTGLTGDLTIPRNVTFIDAEAFKGCSGFTGTLTLSPKLTSIANQTFQGCSNLTGSLTIHSGVISIGKQAFQGCSSLDGTLTLPSTLTAIDTLAFSNCRKLTGPLALPASLTHVGGSAFNGCANLTGDVKLPKAVSYLGASAFAGCGKFTGFTIEPGTALTTPLADGVWAQCNELEYIDALSLPASAMTGRVLDRKTAAGASRRPFHNVQSHTVVYLPTGTDPSLIPASDTPLNYVLDGECLWLSVQDAHDYELPHGFIARKATYNNTSPTDYRTFTGTTAKTVYLPYPATVPTGMRAYGLTKRDGPFGAYEHYFQFTALPEGQRMQANTPYLLLVRDGNPTAPKSFGTDLDVIVPSMPSPDASAVGDTEAGEWFFCGTTEKISNADAAAQGAYNLSNNVWRPITTATPSGFVNHFRCFIKGAPGVVMVKSFAVFFREADDTETSILDAQEALAQGTARIYNVQGQYLGTDFESLPMGLYIINGKKVQKF